MADRKVLNKYYPPDVDPSKAHRGRRRRGKQTKVRTMLPFSVRCLTCGEHIFKGRKFNAMKEEVVGEDYLGIKVFRFYIRCICCASEITFRTDPKHGSYACEQGAKASYAVYQAPGTEEPAPELDAIATLEKRQQESKKELEQLHELEELEERNRREAGTHAHTLMEDATKRPLEDEIAAVFAMRKRHRPSPQSLFRPPSASSALALLASDSDTDSV